jgi:hypothetical protein
VDLNKNYLPNEKFTYNFTIVQRNLISQRSNGYSIVFTPGWYDRSTIDKLSLKVISPIDLLNVTTDPKPSATAGRTLVFSKNNLGMGERYKISVNFLKSALFKLPAQSPQSPQSPQSGWNSPILILLVIIVGVILVAYYYSNYPDDSYYQDYGGPVVSTGGIRRGTGSDEDHSSGGSGAFGGRASSCACVSCACACACACAGGGGGGAGCTRKWRHFCNKCGDPQYPSLLDVTEKEEMGDGK